MARSPAQRSALIKIYWSMVWRSFLFVTLPSIVIGSVIGALLKYFGLSQYTVVTSGFVGVIYGLVVGYLVLGAVLEARSSYVRAVISQG